MYYNKWPVYNANFVRMSLFIIMILLTTFKYNISYKLHCHRVNRMVILTVLCIWVNVVIPTPFNTCTFELWLMQIYTFKMTRCNILYRSANMFPVAWNRNGMRNVSLNVNRYDKWWHGAYMLFEFVSMGDCQRWAMVFGIRWDFLFRFTPLSFILSLSLFPFLLNCSRQRMILCHKITMLQI